MITILFLFLAIVFAILSGVFNGLADTSDSTPYYEDSILSKYRKDVFCKQYSQSWKWMDNVTPRIERFFGSSTIFVFITDFWHYCQLVQLLFLSISTVFSSLMFATIKFSPFYTVFITVPAVLFISSVVFELMFSEILPNNKKYTKLKNIVDKVLLLPFSKIHEAIFKK